MHIPVCCTKIVGKQCLCRADSSLVVSCLDSPAQDFKKKFGKTCNLCICKDAEGFLAVASKYQHHVKDSGNNEKVALVMRHLPEESFSCVSKN